VQGLNRRLLDLALPRACPQRSLRLLKGRNAPRFRLCKRSTEMRPTGVEPATFGLKGRMPSAQGEASGRRCDLNATIEHGDPTDGTRRHRSRRSPGRNRVLHQARRGGGQAEGSWVERIIALDEVKWNSRCCEPRKATEKSSPRHRARRRAGAVREQLLAARSAVPRGSSSSWQRGRLTVDPPLTADRPTRLAFPKWIRRQANMPPDQAYAGFLSWPTACR
jgi:hypothetical protein